MAHTFTVYSLPVSGGAFVAQLGLLSELYSAKRAYRNGIFRSRKDYIPDMVFSASGGNIAAYLGLAAKWSPEGILRISRYLEPDIFIQSWFPDGLGFLPSSLIGVFKGSLYRPGYGGKYLFNSVFTSDSITETEIWTGTYDINKRRAQFFCNRNEDDALVKQPDLDDETQLYGLMPLKFMNGNVEAISETVLASASIPLYVEPQTIGGQNYSDGGLMFASPTAAFTDEVYKIVMGRRVSEQCDPNHPLYNLRSYYFSCYDLDTPEILNAGASIFGITELTQLLHAAALSDRAAAIKLLFQLCGGDSGRIVHHHYPFLKKDGLKDVVAEIEASTHSVCVLYPAGAPGIQIKTFSKQTVEREIEATRNNYGAHVWTYTVQT